MKRAFFGIAFIAAVAAAGCSGADGDGAGGGAGAGGAGGAPIIGPLTWTSPGVTIVGDDDCEFFDDSAYVFDITIQGSDVVMEDADPESGLTVSTTSYSPEQDEVRLSGFATNTTFPPCVVGLDDAMRLLLDNPDLSLDENDTLQVTWDHVETDESDTLGDCIPEWFVPLPCSGEATLTLTQQFE